MIQNNAEEKILNAALNVVAKYTISNTRMHLIAEEAGMVTSNLHYYYETKQDLLLALLPKLNQDATKIRSNYNKDGLSIAGRVDSFFQEKKNQIKSHPEYDYVQIDFWSLGRIDEKIRQQISDTNIQWSHDIVESFREKLPNTSSEKLELLSKVMMGMMYGAAIQYLNEEQWIDLDSYFDLCIDLILNYLYRF